MGVGSIGGGCGGLGFGVLFLVNIYVSIDFLFYYLKEVIIVKE